MAVTAASRSRLDQADCSLLMWWMLWVSRHPRLVLGGLLLIIAGGMWLRTQRSTVKETGEPDAVFTEWDGSAAVPELGQALPKPASTAIPLAALPTPSLTAAAQPEVRRVAGGETTSFPDPIEPGSLPWAVSTAAATSRESTSTPPVWLEGTIEVDALPAPNSSPWGTAATAP